MVYQYGKAQATTIVNNLSDNIGKEIYSTEETVVGTWIDGKTLYQKVYENRSLGNVNNYVVVALPSECVIRHVSGIFPDVNGYLWILPSFYSPTIYASIFFKGNAVYANAVSNFANRPATIIVKYTKTIDEVSTQENLSSASFAVTASITNENSSIQ